MKKAVFIVLFLQSILVWSQIALPIQQSNIPKNHLVANYDFSNVASYSGTGTAVTNIASSTTGAAALFNTPGFIKTLGYVSFNGVNQYMATPNIRPYFKSVNTSVQKSFTMSLWIYPTNLNGVVISELDSQIPSSGWHASNIEIVNGLIKYRIWNGSIVTSSTAVKLNQWHHIALVYDGTSVKGYLNGVLQGTQAGLREIPTTGQNYAIGASETINMGSGGYGNFNLAQFKLHNLPLTDKEILTEYETRKDKFDYTIHSPATNSNPTYWSVSSAWVGETTFSQDHFTPWLNNTRLGWAAGANNTSQFIILNYDEPATMTGIVTQGRANNGGQWVSSAHIDVSMNGTNWTRVLSNATLNSNSIDDVRVNFPNAVFAKYIRVSPLTWNNHITMRLGVIIESKPIVSEGLVVQLDAANSKSYPGTGTTWTDISGNANNGSLTNGPVFNSSNGGHFILDGVNDVVTGTAIPSTSGNNSRTVIAWYKSTINQNISILDKGDFGTINTAEQLFIVAQNGIGDLNVGTTIPPTNIGGIYVAFWGNDIYYPIPATTIFNGNWHCLAYTYDNVSSSVKIFFDGVFASTIYLWNGSWNTLNTSPYRLQSSINTTNNPYWIGRARAKMWGKGSEYANANIGVVNIFNRSLSEQEISQNYNATKPRYEIDKDLVMDLAIAPSSGSTWTDQSGNGNNGTLVGSPTYVSTNGGGYRTVTGQYIATNYNLPNTFTISIVASLNPTTFWATFWGNEVWDSSSGYLSYFSSTTGLNIGSPSNFSTFAVSGINTIHIWDFVVSGNSVTLYRDGLSLGTQIFNSPTVLATNGLYFGARHANIGTSFTDICPGTYYNMRVYKRALIADEITTKFNQIRLLYGL